MTILTTLATTSTQSIANKEATIRFSDYTVTNAGENVTPYSLSNEIATATIQSATSCFRLGRTINQFRRLCLPSTQTLSSVEGSEPTYSSNISLNANEDDDALNELHGDDDAITDDDEDNLICEMNTHAGH